MIGYLASIWRIRHFWWALVRNDLRSRYRRSLLGLGWSLLHPAAMTAVLCVVFVKLFGVDVKTFAPFLFAGLVTWNFLASVMTSGCQCFFQAESYIRQHPAPLAIYPLRTTLSAGVHFLFGLVVVVVFVWCVRGPDNIAALVGLVPCLALLLVLGWSLAICMGVINVLFQDWQHILEILLQILFYTTPIIYPADLLRQRGLGWMLGLNPLGAVLDLVRQPILEGRLPSLEVAGAAAIGAVLAVGVATLVLRRFERQLIFHL